MKNAKEYSYTPTLQYSITSLLNFLSRVRKINDFIKESVNGYVYNNDNIEGEGLKWYSVGMTV